MEARLRALRGTQGHVHSRLHKLDHQLGSLETSGPESSAEPYEKQQVREEGNSRAAPLSTPLLDGSEKPSSEAECIERAAWILESAWHGQDPGKFPEQLVLARGHHRKLLRANVWHVRAVVGLLLLTYLEVPAWCHGGGIRDPWAWVPGTDRCKVKEGHVLVSGFAYLPPAVALIAELFLELLVLRKFLLEYTLERWHFAPMGAQLHATKITKWGMFFAVGGLVDTAMYVVIRPPFRLNFVCRTGLLALLPGVRRMFQSLFNFRVMAEVASVAVFFLGALLFSAFICMVLWQHDTSFAYMEEGEEVRASEGFASFGEAAYSMFVAAATVEFMETLLPSFMAHHSAAFVWVAYLILTKVLLKNMVMDTLISQYLKGAEMTLQRSTQSQATAVAEAFEIMAGKAAKLLPKEPFLHFALALQHRPKPGPASEQALVALHDAAGEVTRENFVDVCMVIMGNFRHTHPLARLGLRKGACVERWCRWILEPEDMPGFDHFMNMVLLLNLLLMVWESTYDVMRWTQPSWMNSLELSFALAYVGEVAAKLSVKTFREYWSSPGDQFDFFTTWVLLLTSLLPYVPNFEANSNLSHYANILRLFRLLKVLKGLKNNPTIQFMLKTVTRILTAGKDILSLMGLFFYFFCGLSVNAFGGLLYEGNEKLEGTEYAENHWYVLNFNDMFMATATYFVNVLCEYVPNYAQAVQRASSWGDVCWWIFPLFYAITSSIMYELLLAFTVDVYMSCKSESFREEEEALEDAELEEDTGAEGDIPEETGQEDKAEKGANGEAEEGEEEAEFEPRHFFKGLQSQLQKSNRAEHHGLSLPMEFREAVDEEYKEALAEARRESVVIEDDGQSQRDRICWAAWLLEDGVAGNPVQKRPAEVVPARAEQLLAKVATGQYGRLMALLIALTLLETPSWCHGPTDSAAWRLWAWSWMPGNQRCPAPAGGDMILSGIYYLPPGISLTIECCLLLAIGRSFLLELRLGAGRRAIFGILLVLGSLVDAAVATLASTPMRFTFIFRTGLLYLEPDVRALILRVFNPKMMGEFGFVAQVFIAVVLLFAWVSYTLLRDLDTVAFHKNEHEAVHLNEGFETLRNSVYTMFVAGISEGFVEIFMPSMLVWPTYGLLWFVFLMLTQVLLLNLVIDAFVAAFLEASEKRLERAAGMQAKATLATFNVLAPLGQAITDETVLPRQTLLDFTEELSRSPTFSHLERSTFQAMLDHFGEVRRGNFCNLCILLQTEVQVTYRDSILKDLAPKLWERPLFVKLRRAAWEPEESPRLGQFFDWVLMLNTLLVILQFQVGPGPMPHWMSVASRCFTMAYVVEVFLKLAVISWQEYWSFGGNRFDFFTTWLLFLTMMLSMLPFDSVHSKLGYYANILRLLRLLRIVRELRHLESFQFMVSTLFRMFLAARNILYAVGVVIFFFATLSSNCFGGIIYEGNPKLEDSALAEMNWYAYNFNDPLMACFTWFTQLLHEYSTEIADALWLASSYGEFAWLVVPAFYLVAVAIMFEILAAFTIETFLALKEEAEKEAGVEVEESEKEEEGPEPQQEVLIESMQNCLADNERVRVNISSDPTFQRRLKSAYTERCEG